MTLFNCGTDQLDLRSQEIRSDAKTDRIFRKQSRLAVETHIVSVIFGWQTGYLNRERCAANGVAKFRLEIDVLCVKAGSVEIRNVRGNKFLTSAQQIEVAFELSANTVQHAAVENADQGPTGNFFEWNAWIRIATRYCRGDGSILAC